MVTWHWTLDLVYSAAAKWIEYFVFGWNLQRGRCIRSFCGGNPFTWPVLMYHLAHICLLLATRRKCMPWLVFLLSLSFCGSFICFPLFLKYLTCFIKWLFHEGTTVQNSTENKTAQIQDKGLENKRNFL